MYKKGEKIPVEEVVRWLRWLLEDYCRTKNEALGGYLFPNGFIPGLSDNKWTDEEILTICHQIGKPDGAGWFDAGLCPHCALQINVRAFQSGLHEHHCDNCLYGQMYGKCVTCVRVGSGLKSYLSGQYSQSLYKLREDLGQDTLVTYIQVLEMEHNAQRWEKLKAQIFAMNFIADKFYYEHYWMSPNKRRFFNPMKKLAEIFGPILSLGPWVRTR